MLVHAHPGGARPLRRTARHGCADRAGRRCTHAWLGACKAAALTVRPCGACWSCATLVPALNAPTPTMQVTASNAHVTSGKAVSEAVVVGLPDAPTTVKVVPDVGKVTIKWSAAQTNAAIGTKCGCRSGWGWHAGYSIGAVAKAAVLQRCWLPRFDSCTQLELAMEGAHQQRPQDRCTTAQPSSKRWGIRSPSVAAQPSHCVAGTPQCCTDPRTPRRPTSACPSRPLVPLPSPRSCRCQPALTA